MVTVDKEARENEMQNKLMVRFKNKLNSQYFCVYAMLSCPKLKMGTSAQKVKT